MKRNGILVLGVLSAIFLSVVLWVSPLTVSAKQRLAFGGGPGGGTFQYFANGIASYVSKQIEDVEVSSEGTGGSAANLKLLHQGEIDFGIVYSGDIFLGRLGRLPKDPGKYDKVLAMAYLYGAPAHLVVLKDSGIRSVKDLAGKRVAVGNAGSGAALSAERFFEHLGIWGKVDRQFLGYSSAADAFKDRKIDAFWVMVGFPNSSIIQAASEDSIVLVDVAREAEESGFLKKYPFYTPVTIPGKTYAGVDEDVHTFEDSAIWCTNDRVDPQMVYNLLRVVFSPKGLKHMAATTKTAEAMTLKDGVRGIITPLAGGAARFWEEQGTPIPESIRPEKK